MGGHGGLNILPQKRWNVYGRENRLRVARDEAQYEAEEAEKCEKHEAAEREYRHKLMLERARQRHGGRANVLLTQDGRAELPASLPAVPGASQEHYNHQQEEQLLLEGQDLVDQSYSGAAAAGGTIGRRHARIQEPDAAAQRSFEMLEQRHKRHKQQHQESIYKEEDVKGHDSMATFEAAAARTTTTATRDANEHRHRGRSLHSIHTDLPLHQKVSARSGPAPSLADLAQQLQTYPENIDSDADLQGAGSSAAGGVTFCRGGVEEAEDRTGEGGNRKKESEPLQHVNLFAAEEAKNPETEAERRDQQRRRGKLDTQTSDAKFDAQFQFAHNLGGTAAVPWYARRSVDRTTNRHVSNTRLLDGNGGAGVLHHEAQLDMWRKKATDALTAAAVAGGVGSRSLESQQQYEQRGRQQGSDKRGLTEKKEKEDEEERMSSESSDVSASSDSDSVSDSSEGGRHRKKKRVKRSRSKETRHKSSDTGKKGGHKEKRRKGKKEEKKRKKDRSLEIKVNEKALMMMKLREERLRREEVERKRERALLREGATADGRRYHAGYGFGR